MNGAANVPRNGNGPRNGPHAHGHGHAHSNGAQQQGSHSWNVDLFHCAPSGSVFTSIFQPCVSTYNRSPKHIITTSPLPVNNRS